MIKEIVLKELIESKIYLVRDCKVMLDRDLAKLYGVPTFRLNEAVKRNNKRFPADFMFKLTKDENNRLGSQIAILTEKKFDINLPYAFTEQGVAMLSSVLNSDRAIQVNIQIMRTFTQLRNLLSSHQDLVKKMENMEKNYDRQFRIVFEIIRELNNPKEKIKRKIGFQLNSD